MINNQVLIIAEAGVNHNGSIKIAKELINVASDAGADFVKFQSFKADKLVSKTAKKADYQIQNSAGNNDSQYAMLKSLELSHAMHLELLEYCKLKNIGFLSTAFDRDGIDYLNDLGLGFFKVPSGEITNYSYLKRLSEIGKPVILSTGMADLAEIEIALNVLMQGVDKKDITILHCNTEYPTPMQDVNLKAMISIQNELGVKVGYSDHTHGVEVAIAAVALGASVIEKHFTLDREMSGPDHKASLEPLELKSMILSIRNISKAISGDGIKRPSDSEAKNIVIVRKSIHLKESVNEGDIITEELLIPLRPGDGISPMEWNQVVGKVARLNLKKNHKLKWSDLE